MTFEVCQYLETTTDLLVIPSDYTTIEILKREITVIPILRAGLVWMTRVL